MRKWRQKTLIGVSLKVVAPTGQYDPTKLINLGANRWAFKPELGLSRRWGHWVLDAYAAVWFFTRNPDFFSRNQYVPAPTTQTQDPIAAFETHLSYDFRPRLWVSLDGNFWRGGRTSLDGVENPATLQKTSRIGVTASFPLTRTPVDQGRLRGRAPTSGSEATTRSPRRRGSTRGSASRSDPAQEAPTMEPPDSTDFSLVLGGPLYQLFLRSGLAKPPLDLLRRRVLALPLLTWLPLLVLSVLQGQAVAGVGLPFLRDLEAQARFLVALPLLIVAEVVVHRRLAPAMRLFVEKGIVRPDDR